MTALADAIGSQADAIERMLGLDVGAAVARLEPAARIWLVGTGTSQHAAELGAWVLGASGRRAQWASAASFARFGPPLEPDDGVIVITHTGETAFARRSRERALAAGSRLVSITAQGSAWPEAIGTVPREASDTYTVSYTAALVVLARIADGLGAAGVGPGDLAELPDRVRAASEPTDAVLAPVPERALAVAAVGPGAITAREGALKLREAARVLAEGYEAEYLLHGAAVPLGPADGLLLLQPSADPDGLLRAIGEAAGREGVTVTTIEEPAGLPPLPAQIPLTVRLQAMASRLADVRGHDPDTVISPAWSGSVWDLGA